MKALYRQTLSALPLVPLLEVAVDTDQRTVAVHRKGDKEPCNTNL